MRGNKGIEEGRFGTCPYGMGKMGFAKGIHRLGCRGGFETRPNREYRVDIERAGLE